MPAETIRVIVLATIVFDVSNARLSTAARRAAVVQSIRSRFARPLPDPF
jgi:hypothetical protein